MLPAPFDRPVVIAGIALVILLVALVGLARRRTRAVSEETASLSDFPEAAGAGEEVAYGSEPEEEPRTPAAPDAEAFGDAPAPTGGPAAERGSAAGEGPAASGDLAPEPGGAVASGSGIAALEERLARMEARVEELTDARERLERQVAAQTEELRVQRAAIARTQRVLRTVSRPEDEPSEPAPKT